MNNILVPESKNKRLFRDDGKRWDGREIDEVRSFSCRVGEIKNAQGSAYVEHGGNIIIAAVYGPREVHPRHMSNPESGILRVYYRMGTFSVHERKRPAPNRRDNEISKVIKEALESVLYLEAYPDSQIEIHIQVIAADGGTRCACTTAASLALADAGIPMSSLLVGLAAGKAEGQVILDLMGKEDKVGQADLPAVVVMKDKSIALLQFDGQMTIPELERSFELILKGAESIYEKQKEALKDKYASIMATAQKESEEIAALQPEKKVEEVKSEPAQPQPPVQNESTEVPAQPEATPETSEPTVAPASLDAPAEPTENNGGEQ